MDLSVRIYKFCEDNIKLKNNYSLKDQLQRCSISISSNIAEWSDRETDKEFLRFLYIARWSCSELRTQLLIVKKLNYLDEEEYNDLENNIMVIHKMLNGLIKKIWNDI